MLPVIYELVGTIGRSVLAGSQERFLAGRCPV